jgi:hypothetical protein
MLGMNPDRERLPTLRLPHLQGKAHPRPRAAPAYRQERKKRCQIWREITIPALFA